MCVKMEFISVIEAVFSAAQETFLIIINVETQYFLEILMRLI